MCDYLLNSSSSPTACKENLFDLVSTKVTSSLSLVQENIVQQSAIYHFSEAQGFIFIYADLLIAGNAYFERNGVTVIATGINFCRAARKQRVSGARLDK